MCQYRKRWLLVTEASSTELKRGKECSSPAACAARLQKFIVMTAALGVLSGTGAAAAVRFARYSCEPLGPFLPACSCTVQGRSQGPEVVPLAEPRPPPHHSAHWQGGSQGAGAACYIGAQCEQCEPCSSPPPALLHPPLSPPDVWIIFVILLSVVALPGYSTDTPMPIMALWRLVTTGAAPSRPHPPTLSPALSPLQSGLKARGPRPPPTFPGAFAPAHDPPPSGIACTARDRRHTKY